MYKDLGFKLVGQVKDGAGLKGIGNVKVTIVEKETGKPVFSGMTNEKGEFFKSVSNFSLNQTMNLTIKLEKEGYLTRELTFNQKLERSGDIDINKKEDLLMDELKVGVDIGKIVDLNPIYFDSGKWNIRTDAAVELDKIVKAMNDNPSLSIEVGSHTDSKGQAKANLTLSDKRAKSTADYIISKGISASRISGKGYGESQLVNKCKDGVKCSDSEHQQNRRTEFKVVKL
jgi:outer membrane protein OmpA-like peptidoglycan-associated protein